MAVIPRDAVDFLTTEINTLSADAQAKVLKVLESITWTPDTIADCRDVVLEAIRMVLPEYADLVAQATADFYDASRELCIGEQLGAAAISGYDEDKTEAAIRAAVQRIVDGKPVQSFNDFVLQRMDYELKRASGYTMTQNAAADPRKPRYARVPSGSETCDFCLMLASRGFVYTSKKNAGAVDHYHANCDCRVVCGWDGASIDGYDPDALYRKWNDNIDATAAERAKKNGTTEEAERAAIIKAYGDAAKVAKKRRKTA